MADNTDLKPTPANMEVTSERAMKIKLALLRQYADQYGLEITGWTETKDGVSTKVIINERFEVQSIEYGIVD